MDEKNIDLVVDAMYIHIGDINMVAVDINVSSHY